MESKPPSTDSGQARPVWQALQMAWELGYLIIIPLLVFGLGGRWLDGQFGTKPWLFLSGMILAVISTTIFLIRKFSKLIHDIETQTPAQGGSDQKKDQQP